MKSIKFQHLSSRKMEVFPHLFSTYRIAIKSVQESRMTTAIRLQCSKYQIILFGFHDVVDDTSSKGVFIVILSLKIPIWKNK